MTLDCLQYYWDFVVVVVVVVVARYSLYLHWGGLCQKKELLVVNLPHIYIICVCVYVCFGWDVYILDFGDILNL